MGSPDRRRLLGAEGEQAASAWYTAAGYRVVDRNWRCADGELDLVLARNATVVFCEVKTRTSDRFGAPVEAVTPTKQRRIRRLAAQWLAAERAAGTDRRRVAEIRFDVASVLAGEVEVVESAF